MFCQKTGDNTRSNSMVSDVIWRTIQALVSFKLVIWTCMHAILIVFEKLEIAFETILLYQYFKSIFSVRPTVHRMPA